MKNKANKGFIKELSKESKAQPKSSFNYSNPVVTTKRIKSVSFKSNSREVRTPESTFIEEQSNALKSHKGIK